MKLSFIDFLKSMLYSNTMRNLIIALLVVSFSANIVEAVKYTPSRIPFYILNAATAYNIDVNLMYSICQVESKCDSRAINKDDGTPEQKAAGIKIKAFGLFQIQLATAKSLGFIDKETITITKKRGKKIRITHVVVDHSRDLLKADVNSLYAAKLINKLYKKYHSTERVISAFNAGHPIKGNSEYVLKVLKQYIKLTIDKRN